MRKQFTFYESYWFAVKKLQKQRDRLSALEAICAYAIEGEELPMTDAADAVFTLIKPVLDSAEKMSKGGIRSRKGSNKVPVRLDQGSRNEKEGDIDIEIDIESECYKPTLADVQSFCSAEGLKTDPQYFWNYYQSRGWSGVKDWKARIRAWDAKDKKPEAGSFTYGEEELKAIQALKRGRSNA